MTSFARETAEEVLARLGDADALKKKLALTDPERRVHLVMTVGSAIDEKTATMRSELKEFIAWWMRIIHHDHIEKYAEPHWQKCAANVCRSTADSFKDLKAPVAA